MVYEQSDCLQWLAESGIKTALKPKKCQEMVQRKYYDPYRSQNIKAALHQVSRHGVDFRNPFNQTLLMVAVIAGNSALAKAVIEEGANQTLSDNRGYDAFQLSFALALKNRTYAEKSFRLPWTLKFR